MDLNLTKEVLKSAPFGSVQNGTDLRRFIVYDLMPRSLDLSGFPGFEFTEKLLKSVPFGSVQNGTDFRLPFDILTDV